MARCYELLGDLRNALRYYRKFAAQHPQSISTWHSKASIANELGDYLDAIDYLESIPDDYEHHQLVLLERTKAHYHLGNYDLAILYGNRVQVDAVELNDAINLHYYLVNAAIAEEDFGFAFDMVVELEKLEPGPSRDIMTQYVMLAINTDNQDEGLQKGLEFCREFEPDKTIYPFLSQYLDSNFNQLELHWFEEFATCSQEFSHLYQRKLYNEGKYQEYARRYDSLEEVNPYLHLLMVRSLHKLGKPHEALSHIGQALDSYREPQDLYPFYAMEYTIRHEEDMPVLDISRQLYENFPSDEALYNYLTDLYQSREFDEFFDVLETYDYHGEERYLIMYMAGNSALEIEEYEQAIAYYLQVQPENSTMRLNTYHRIAYAYDMLEDDLNALEYYRQALEHADSSRAAINIERRITHLEQQVSPENTTEN
nr:tetratricopeptide repeat protein [Desulfurispira natronophila]